MPGVFVRPGDPADLAEKVSWLRDNPAEVERYGRNARLLAEREFGRDELAGAGAPDSPRSRLVTVLSYCVVNTNGREHLMACLDAIARHHPSGMEHEVLVLDNASDDGSAEAVRARGGDVRLIALERREGKAAADTRLLREAAGRYCLLLNEDSEVQAGCARALVDALEADPCRGRGGRPAPHRRGHAEGLRLAAARRGLGAGRRAVPAPALAVQSRGSSVRPVGWVPVERDAGAQRGRGRGGMARPGLLRLLRRDRLLQAPARRGLAHPLRARRPGRPTTTSSPPTPRPCAAGSWSSTAGATATCAGTSRP